MSDEPVSREEVLGALEHTFARGAARVEFRYEFDLRLGMDEVGSPPVRLGPHVRRLLRRPSRPSVGALLRAIGRAVRRRAGRLVARPVMRLLRRMMGNMAAPCTVGVVDFGAHRCMYGYPGRSEAMLVAGDKLWQGSPGAAVDALSEKPAPAIQPLWMLDLVRGVAEAHGGGEEPVDGHTCRRVVGHADLGRAAEAVPYEMALPPGMNQLGQVARVPLELWIDSERQIRRIRYDTSERADAPRITTILDLRELGVEPPSDWSRLEVPVASRDMG